jgi:hypothetical protein
MVELHERPLRPPEARRNRQAAPPPIARRQQISLHCKKVSLQNAFAA